MVDASRAPEQALEATEPQPIALHTLAGTLHMKRLARYRIQARVLSRERYYLGWRGEVSPLDLALGCGRMADPGVDEYIDWQHGGRWHFYSWSGQSAYQTPEINAQSANVHIVPDTRNLSRALLRLSRGRLIALTGSLVRISDDAGRPENSWQKLADAHGRGRRRLRADVRRTPRDRRPRVPLNARPLPFRSETWQEAPMQFGRVRDPGLVDFELPPLSARSRAVLAAAPTRAHASAGEPWLRLGAPVFHHRDWEGSLYANESDPKAHMRIYASKLGALELNSTFYGISSESTIERWVADTSESFRFCPKIPRAISHELQARDVPQLTAAFVGRMRRLGPRLGPSLLQLPESFGPDALPALRAVLETFPEDFALALEVRHPAWFESGSLREELLALLEQRQIASVITDVAGRRDVCHGSLSLPLAFIRFVGEDGHESDQPRTASWIARLCEWRGAGLQSAYLFIHQPDDGVAPQLLASTVAVAQRAGVQLPTLDLEPPPTRQLGLFG